MVDHPNILEAVYQAIQDQRVNPPVEMDPYSGSGLWAFAQRMNAEIVELGDRQWDQVITALETQPGFTECLADRERPQLWGRTLVHVPVPSWMMAW